MEWQKAMRLITEPMIIDAVDCSVVETIEAFVRYRPGFHGDTGVRDYLYHRLMTNLPNGGTYQRPDGGGTLLAQAEWYTALKYRRTGQQSSQGRFDIGIPNPHELNILKARPLIAFECGRNKKASNLLRDVDAVANHDGPEPGDITKLSRELNHAGLPYGYALEFYDKGSCSEAEQLVHALRMRSSLASSDRLHVAVVVCVGDRRPNLTFLPLAWEKRIQLTFLTEMERIESLMCERIGGPAPGHGTREGQGNRVTRQDFVSSCSAEGYAIIQAIEKRFGSEVRLVFGRNSMTMNRPNGGRLLRIVKASNSICDLNSTVGSELAALLDVPVQPNHQITETDAFREAVVAAVAGSFGK